MNDNTDNKIWNLETKQTAIVATTIAVLIGVYVWVIVPIQALQTNQAVVNQKLDTIIAWEKMHDENTLVRNKELNETFAYIYEKLGQKYNASLGQY